MGLDIYLTDVKRAQEIDDHEKLTDELWQQVEAGKITEEEYRERRPEYPGRGDVASVAYPDHLCNRRYLRSSYNESGFNRAVPNFLGDEERPGDFYWIFEPLGRNFGEEYEVKLTTADLPRLELCRRRAVEVAEELRTCTPLQATQATTMLGDREHMWSTPPSEEQVLAWYRDEVARRAESPGFESYSNAKGTVFGFEHGLEVLAAATGRDILGAPVAILVYRPSADSLEHYVQSAEIAAEFCEEAANLIQADGAAVMTWSG